MLETLEWNIISLILQGLLLYPFAFTHKIVQLFQDSPAEIRIIAKLSE